MTDRKAVPTVSCWMISSCWRRTWNKSSLKPFIIIFIVQQYTPSSILKRKNAPPPGGDAKLRARWSSKWWRDLIGINSYLARHLHHFFVAVLLWDVQYVEMISRWRTMMYASCDTIGVRSYSHTPEKTLSHLFARSVVPRKQKLQNTLRWVLWFPPWVLFPERWCQPQLAAPSNPSLVLQQVVRARAPFFSTLVRGDSWYGR